MTSMEPSHIELARHALGLPNARRRSYRNHYVCGEGGADYLAWQEMVANEFARRKNGAPISGGDDIFWLTPKGAKLALQKGERLDPEDFPDITNQ